jgi:ligand-binding sensor domain-containing protein/two-component sensor histidine kinase
LIKKILIPLFLFAAFYTQAQNFNYVNYDTREGLAGSTVYDMCQDKDGFMWFATENGLSRFDGTSFKNFTVKDGLPDNEVLKVFADSKGRLWIGTFNKELCYYYNGKIYNRNNDTLLLKLKFRGYAAAIAEDKNGRLAFSDWTDKLLFLDWTDSERKVSELMFSSKVSVSSFMGCTGKVFMIGDGTNVYLYQNNVLSFFCPMTEMNGSVNEKKPFFNSFTSCDGKIKKYILQKQNYIVTSSNASNYLKFCCTYDGAWEVDTVKNEWSVHYLKGKKVTKAMADDERNLWFSTSGEGVYKLPSQDIKTIKFPEIALTTNNEVFSLVKYNNKILAGLNHGQAAFFSNGEYTVTNFSGDPPNIFRPQTNRLNTSVILADNKIVIGFDKFVLLTDGKRKIYNYIYPIKSVAAINNDSILAGTSSSVFILRQTDLKIIDTIWRERCTKVFYHSGKYYIGTLNGLYEVNKDKSYNYLGNIHHSLTRRITDIKVSQNGDLWVATADLGIVALKNNKVTAVIKDTNGLSSNICKVLFMQNNYLWVGTNKGLNKINLSNTNYSITKYSVSDGLPSDIVNAVYAEGEKVYVGSPNGLTILDEGKVSLFSICRLKMMNIVAGGKDFDSTNNSLSYKNSSIRFNYTAVSLKSAGDIIYNYRLIGVSDIWNQTEQTTLSYPSLPSGNYELQLYAVNKFGVVSKTLTVRFSVSTPFWKAWWFYSLLIVFVIALTGWLVNARNKKYNKKLKEANTQQKQFAALEQQALQAQMNPHFIFNCLNGIQQYILTGNKEKANEYLTGFARLIRQTLDNSGMKTITLQQEAKYLTEYLEMEKMRAAGTFSYSVFIDEKASAANTEIPSMLLQPYVENALRHGLRYKTDGTGKVNVSFTRHNNDLLCTVKDNGVGRKHAAEIKSRQHIEYQSKGMTLTERRIDLLNKINDIKMQVVVNDLVDENNKPAGTEVIIKIPIQEWQ